MSHPTPSTKEADTAELRALITTDLAASNDLAARISELRQDTAEGKSLPDRKIDLMERSNKDIAKDLMLRVERIEASTTPLDATDREMLQALSARLGVCDLMAMRLAELRDLEFDARGKKLVGFLKGVEEPEVVASEAEGPVEELPSVGRLNLDDDAGLSERGSGPSTGGYESNDDDNDDDEASSEHSEQPVIDMSGWPLLYRMLSVDPETMASEIEPLVKASYKRLALTHSPRYLPNDPDAPALWNKVTKAYDVLVDSGKRMFYDAHGNVPPAGLEDFDVSVLHDPKERR